MKHPAASCTALLVLVAANITPTLLAQSQPTAPPRPASELVAEGLTRARAENKEVLVVFGASWCPACAYLDRFLADTARAAAIMRANFVIVNLDALETSDKVSLVNPGTVDWAKSVGNDLTGTGFPFMIMLDANGKKLGDSNVMPPGSALPPNYNIGYPRSANEVVGFDALLKRTAPRMTADQRAQIKTYLDRVAGRTSP